MDDWHQDWLRAFETLTTEVGQLFDDLGREVSEAADDLLNLSEEVAEDIGTALVQVDEILAPKLDQLDAQMAQWLDPVLQAMFGLTATIDRAVEPVTHTVEPWLNQHPVCVGCRNYHGQDYGGSFLVCAIHPYGVAEGVDSCSDKEPVSWNFPFPSNDSNWEE